MHFKLVLQVHRPKNDFAGVTAALGCASAPICGKPPRIDVRLKVLGYIGTEVGQSHSRAYHSGGSDSFCVQTGNDGSRFL